MESRKAKLEKRAFSIFQPGSFLEDGDKCSHKRSILGSNKIQKHQLKVS